MSDILPCYFRQIFVSPQIKLWVILSTWPRLADVRVSSFRKSCQSWHFVDQFRVTKESTAVEQQCWTVGQLASHIAVVFWMLGYLSQWRSATRTAHILFIWQPKWVRGGLVTGSFPIWLWLLSAYTTKPVTTGNWPSISFFCTNVMSMWSRKYIQNFKKS